MSSSSSSSSVQIPTTQTGLTVDELLDVVATRRRRRVLRTLHQHDGCETYASLAGRFDRESDDITEVELHHLAVPKLETSGLVDAEDGVVVLTDGGRAVVDWLTQVTPR